jgi:hypothetical protein
MKTYTPLFPSKQIHHKLSVLALAACASCATVQSAEKGGFAFDQKADRLIIKYAGQPLTDYVFSDTNILRPYFTSVHTIDGIQVTRNHPPIAGQDAVDHPNMHPGIWMAFGNISGQDFWRNKATVRHERLTEKPFADKDKLTFATESTMITTNGESLAKLVSHFTLQTQKEGYLLIWATAFTPTVDGFVFGDQEEMGFGVRVATLITEKNGGLVQNSDGVKGAKAAWGKTASWCDYSGTISNRAVGMTVMPDPKNFRPSWFHSRDYGLVVANPFGQKAFTKEGDPSQVPVKKGDAFNLRFAAFIHSTPTNEPSDIVFVYRRFTTGK